LIARAISFPNPPVRVLKNFVSRRAIPTYDTEKAKIIVIAIAATHTTTPPMRPSGALSKVPNTAPNSPPAGCPPNAGPRVA